MESMLNNDLQGWQEIIAEMKEKLAPYDVFLTQVKEKWGELRVIYHFEGSKEDREQAQRIIDAAVDKSTETCEWCGRQGYLVRIRGRWLKTLCQNCQREEAT
jgi:hypothetical protein